jgi:predicted RNase H-like nuclease (RuvC/YqgF family)
MNTKKITKEDILKTITEEAYVIKRKRELFSDLKKMNEELKDLNECRGIAGTFGFNSSSDVMNKSANGTGFKNPQSISYVAQLEKELGGFGDEFSDTNINEANIEALKQENETLKKQIEEMATKINTAITPVK